MEPKDSGGDFGGFVVSGYLSMIRRWAHDFK